MATTPPTPPLPTPAPVVEVWADPSPVPRPSIPVVEVKAGPDPEHVYPWDRRRPT